MILLNFVRHKSVYIYLHITYKLVTEQFCGDGVLQNEGETMLENQRERYFEKTFLSIPTLPGFVGCMGSMSWMYADMHI